MTMMTTMLSHPFSIALAFVALRYGISELIHVGMVAIQLRSVPRPVRQLQAA